MRLGVCWCPEQWPESRWATDAAMMRDAGLQLVRIGEFAWARYAPERERWAWVWLDRVVDLIGAAGPEVMIGTPTATPPIWLAQERPAIITMMSGGARRQVGARRHTWPHLARLSRGVRPRRHCARDPVRLNCRCDDLAGGQRACQPRQHPLLV